MTNWVWGCPIQEFEKMVNTYAPKRLVRGSNCCRQDPSEEQNHPASTAVMNLKSVFSGTLSRTSVDVSIPSEKKKNILDEKKCWKLSELEAQKIAVGWLHQKLKSTETSWEP